MFIAEKTKLSPSSITSLIFGCLTVRLPSTSGLPRRRSRLSTVDTTHVTKTINHSIAIVHIAKTNHLCAKWRYLLDRHITNSLVVNHCVNHTAYGIRTNFAIFQGPAIKVATDFNIKEVFRKVRI